MDDYPVCEGCCEMSELRHLPDGRHYFWCPGCKEEVIE